MKRRGQSDRLQTRGQPYIGDFAAGVIVFVGAAGRHSQVPRVVVGGAGIGEHQERGEKTEAEEVAPRGHAHLILHQPFMHQIS